jgi:hypothetical protein
MWMGGLPCLQNESADKVSLIYCGPGPQSNGRNHHQTGMATATSTGAMSDVISVVVDEGGEEPPPPPPQEQQPEPLHLGATFKATPSGAPGTCVFHFNSMTLYRACHLFSEP